MQIHELTIACEDPSEMRKFYSDHLGFPEIETVSQSDGYSFQAGYTRVNCIPGDKDARYHFAFNVQPDRFEAAIEWMQQCKMDLIPDPEEHTIYVDFPNWKARSIYFTDACGNIVEIIGRAALPLARNAPKFSAKSLLGISEIGIVCEDVEAMREWIENTHGIPGFVRQQNTPEFTALGDDEGLLLLVPTGRKWFMGNFEGQHFPLAIKGVNGSKSFQLLLP